MSRIRTALLVVLAALGALPAFAQETAGPGKIEVTIIPGGGVFFTETDQNTEPSFGNYDLGGAVTFNVWHVGFEGEVAGSLGIPQNIEFGRASAASKLKTPNMLNYSGNVVVPLVGPRHSVVPYVTGGAGGLTLLKKAEVGITSTDTFFTGNAGGGVKWYAGRWGLRADYRLIAVQSKDDASSFFGQETRYGHRVYGAVILNLGQ